MNNGDENIEDLEALAKRGLELFEEDYTESIQEVMPNTLEDEQSPEAKVIPLRRNWSKWLSVASVLIVGVVGYLMFTPSTLDGTALYSSYVEVPPYVISQSERGSDNQINDLTKAETHYAAGEYKNYISAVKIMENRPPSTLLYEAISNMQLGNIETAVNLLSDEATIPKNLNDIRLWNLGLCYLQLRDYQQANSVLADLTNQYQYKRKEAQEILTLIDNY